MYPYRRRYTPYFQPNTYAGRNYVTPKAIRQASSEYNIDRTQNYQYYKKTYTDGASAVTLHHVSDMQGIVINPTNDQLLNIPQGVAEGERIGTDVQVHHLLITGVVKWECVPDSLDPPTNPIVRLWLVKDKTPVVGSTLDTRAVFRNDSTNKDASVTPLREPTFLDRFDILDDALLQIDHTRESTIDSSVPTWHFGSTLRPFKLECFPQQRGPVVTVFKGMNSGILKNNFTLLGCATAAKTQVSYNIEAVYSDQ